MKCIIISRTSDAQWVQRFFPGSDPYLIKFVNKPLIEYYIDYCFLNGIKKIRIVSDSPSSDLRNYCSNGEKWGVEISYSLYREDDTDEKIISKNSRFCSGEDVFIVSGIKFIHYDKSAPGNYILQEIRSVSDYYELNMAVLSTGNDKYVFPGYTKENGVLIGQNVEISKNTDLQKPFSIGDNVRLEQLTVIGPMSIIGSNVIISSSSTITESIICDGTFIGTDLDISGKIVAADRIISPQNGAIVPIVDKFMVSGVNDHRKNEFSSKVFSILMAVVLIIAMFPFFLVLCSAGLLSGKLKRFRQAFIIDRSLKTEDFNILEISRGDLTGRIWHRLSMEKFIFLFSVLSGKFSLSGNRIMEDNTRSRKVISGLDSYSPGIFNYSETVEISLDEKVVEVNEHYYNSIKSFSTDSAIVIKALVLRMIG